MGLQISDMFDIYKWRSGRLQLHLWRCEVIVLTPHSGGVIGQIIVCNRATPPSIFAASESGSESGFDIVKRVAGFKEASGLGQRFQSELRTGRLHPRDKKVH